MQRNTTQVRRVGETEAPVVVGSTESTGGRWGRTGGRKEAAAAL